MKRIKVIHRICCVCVCVSLPLSIFIELYTLRIVKNLFFALLKLWEILQFVKLPQERPIVPNDLSAKLIHSRFIRMKMTKRRYVYLCIVRIVSARLNGVAGKVSKNTQFLGAKCVF